MKADSFSIKSSSSDRELVFSRVRENHFTVELVGTEFRAIREVYTFTDHHGLPKLFCWLAAQQRPWSGNQSWGSLEGEFSFSATCSQLGEVFLLVSIWGLPGAPEEWRVSGSVTTELGQLPKIAEGVSRLFGVEVDT
jgi:hypothetical protein